jgi:uncharacterized membrane protein YebE (DUF533 family)
MALSRIATVLGGLLLSKSGRRVAGRHAGKIALATLAFELYRQHKGRGAPQAGGRTAAGAGTPPHPRRRWSGRQV